MAAPDRVKLVVTSWSEEGEAHYGHRFRQGYVKHWAPLGIKLEVVTDQMLTSDPKIRLFLHELECDPATADRSDIHHGASKWSKKVLALTGRDLTTIDGWMLWIDGDVGFTAAPSERFFETVCPDGSDMTFLGRPWAYASETGFVAYDMRSTRTRMLLAMMRAVYLTGYFRELREWGDAGVFDWCRDRVFLRESDLSGHLKFEDVQQNGLHVWPHTVLETCLRHNKGPKRQKAAYG